MIWKFFNSPGNIYTVRMNSSKQIFLHPLCIASICDHYTRIVVGGTKLPQNIPVIGFLIGVQNSLDVTLFDISDAVYEFENGELNLNIPEIKRILGLRTAVYPSYELLGWFAVGTAIEAYHTTAQRSIVQTLNESPLFLLLDPTATGDSKQLPLKIFEEVHEASAYHFVQVPFKLQSLQAERIAVDEVIKTSGSSGASRIEVQNQSFTTSVRTIGDKISIIVSVLKDMSSGRIPPDPEVMRKASKICQMLPASRDVEFERAFASQVDECFLMTYLAAASKTSGCISELTGTYHVLYAERMMPHF